MTARFADEAFAAIVASVRTVAGCITRRPIITINMLEPAPIVRLSFGPASQPVAMRTTTGTRRIYLSINEEYVVDRLTGAAGVRRRAYYYRIRDRDENEVLAYHWHPHSRSAVTEPHMHLSNQVRPITLGRGSEPLPLADLHLATGMMTLADLVRMLITEFQVEPLIPGWREVLATPPA